MSHTTTVKSVPIRSITALQQAVAKLQAQGVKCELVQNAQPRMYYADQLQRHLKQKSEICPYVLKLPDAYYDVGFLQQEDGSLVPVFDDYNYPSRTVKETQTGKSGIAGVLGATWKGKVEHWSGSQDDKQKEQTRYSIGKLMNAYSTAAAVEKAVRSGYTVESTKVKADGTVEIMVDARRSIGG